MRPAVAAAIVKWELILVLACLSRTGTTSALALAPICFSSSRESMAYNKETYEEVDKASLEEKSRQDSLYRRRPVAASTAE
jgi:hypothetical protein